MVLAGESQEDVAENYCLNEAEVKSALKFESRMAA